jgi:predicted short-subunit dehydrogenase-like oxidoreductase (DUF2520 family)
MNIVCIGSGNVAIHLAKALNIAGHSIIQVWSKTLENAVLMADQYGASAISDLDQIISHADLYLVAVKDDGISAIGNSLKDVSGLVVHTSGATDLSMLSATGRYGVLYPLQTFSKSRAVDFRKIPLCIEAQAENDLSILKDLAAQISDLIYLVDSKQRRVLHLAAVFACNFTNHLYEIGFEILKDNDLDFSILKPLIEETAHKILTELPYKAQTGPALRGDETTMAAHQALLASNPTFSELYKILSNSIKKTHS